MDEQTQPILHQTLETIVQRGFPLGKKQLRNYYIIQHLYQQQRELYRENKRSIADRIVSLHQPQVGCSYSMMYKLTSHTILAYFPPELLPSARSLQGSQA